jgi:capsular polysaccharide biosynthesis protein
VRRYGYEANRVLRVLAVAVVLGAVCVTSASLMQTPTYEASALLLVGGQQEDQWINSGGSGEEMQTLEWVELPTQTMAHAIESRPVAEKAIQRLGLQMNPAELLDKLTVEQVDDTRFICLSYEDTDPERAQRIVNTVGEVSSELISERSAPGIQLTATVYEKASVPTTPVSPRPVRNGLLTLVVGLVLCAGTVVGLPGVGARLAGTLGTWSVRPLGEAGAPAVPRPDPRAERIKEQELLEALDRRGKLTAVEAALETSLSVEEANRMLFELAVRGHLEVTAEPGKLLYSFWEHGA